MTQSIASDVVIIGASLVGASCAIALHQLGLKVTIIDAKPMDVGTSPASELPLDNRIYALSSANIAWLSRLNVWKNYDQSRAQPIEKMQIWSDAGNEIQLDAFKANALNLGTIIESNQLLSALYQTLDTLDIQRLTAKVESIDYTADAAIVQGDFPSLQTQLVIAADGAESWVRKNAKIHVTQHDYAQQGVVANFKTTLPHNNIARQWFKGGSVLALLPLPNQAVSMVWSTDNQHADHLMSLTATELASEITRASENTLGDLQLLTAPKTYPLQTQQADSLVADRLILIGDAAHTIHPLAGQGVNLGFRDVIALVNIFKAAPKHIDTPRTLQHFARARQPDILAMRSLTHGLHKLFASDSTLTKKSRNIGFTWLQKQEPLKNKLMQLMLNN